MTREDFLQTPRIWRVGIPLFAALTGTLIWLFDLNRELFYLINGLHVLAPDGFWARLTVMGDALLALPLTLIFLRYMPRVFAPMFVATFITPIILHSIKGLADLPRPGGAISPVDFHVVEPLYTHHSFPSGHSTMAFAWICIVIFQLDSAKQRLWGSVLLIVGSCVALSRVIVGAHWPVDVFFGAALGWSTAMLSIWISIHWHGLHKPTGQKWIIGFFIVLALISLLFIDNDYSMANSWQSGIILFSLLFALYPWFDSVIRKLSQTDSAQLQPGQLKIQLTQSLFLFRSTFSKHCSGCYARIKSTLLQLGPRKKWIFHLAFLAVLGLVVDAIIGWGTLLRPWLSIPLDKLFLAILLLLSSYVFRALRLVFYFEEIPLKRSLACLRLSIIHNFYNNLLPMRSGELSFPILMSREYDIPYRKSLAALLWLRLLDLAAILMIGGIATLLVLDLWFLALVAVLIGALLPLWMSRWFHYFTSRIMLRKPTWEEKIEMIRQGWPQQKIDIWRSWGWTLLNWIIKLLSFAIVLQWFIDMQAIYALVAIIGAELSSVLPIHSVGGFGTYESAALIALSLFGQSSTEALKAVVNLHLFVIGMTLISGLFAQLLVKDSPLLKIRSLLSRKNHV